MLGLSLRCLSKACLNEVGKPRLGWRIAPYENLE